MMYGLPRKLRFDKTNRKSGKFEIFLHDEKDSSSLLNNSINVVFEDSKKRLWLGGNECGLNLFNRKLNLLPIILLNRVCQIIQL